MILLDSSILIELFRKKDKAKTICFKLLQKDKSFAISTITYYEIGIGNRKSHWDYWKLLSSQFTIIPFDKRCSDTAIQIYFDLIKRNKMIDLADLFIGATARANFLPISTLNLKHFERINNLEIIL